MRIVFSAGTLFVFLLLVAALATVSERPGRGAAARDVFTPEHATVAAAMREFAGWRPSPAQPIQFTHKTHLARNLKCEGCHATAAIGPVAGIPDTKFCMSCHQLFATDKPEVRKLAAYFSRGEDVPWERVYGFSPSAHVKFNHAPHVRAGVQCSACHGDLTRQTVAVRSVNLTMGYCLACHRSRKASIDCTTCHF